MKPKTIHLVGRVLSWIGAAVLALSATVFVVLLTRVVGEEDVDVFRNYQDQMAICGAVFLVFGFGPLVAGAALRKLAVNRGHVVLRPTEQDDEEDEEEEFDVDEFDDEEDNDNDPLDDDDGDDDPVDDKRP
jgi:hypothetical protein